MQHLSTSPTHTRSPWLGDPWRPGLGPMLLAALLTVLLGACGGEPATDSAPAEAPAPAAEQGATENGTPATEAMLPRPFNAEQIRDSWVEGLVVVLENVTPLGVQHQRWTVVAADDEGAEIEFAMVDAEGVVQGDPVRRRSEWDELASHGDSPAATTTREAGSLETPLGTLDGWTYVHTDPATDSVTTSFFSNDHPGAPVSMVVNQSGVETLKMTLVDWQVGG